MFKLWTSGALLGTVAYLILLGHFKIETHKRAKYSKSLDPDEIDEVLMDEESDEELEDRDKVVEPRVQSSSPLDDEDDIEEIEVAF
jgi:CRISPR/Cas system-associated exonuclease Cas4 (RecB family)